MYFRLNCEYLVNENEYLVRECEACNEWVNVYINIFKLNKIL